MSASTDSRCERCRNPVSGEDLFCDYCGCEVAGSARGGAGSGPAGLTTQGLAYTLDCLQCGATIRYDAKLAAPRCAFCGSTRVEEKKSESATIVADQVVPFQIDRGEATARIRKWLGQGFWRPGDLAARAQLTEMRPVFLPYWRFSCDADVHWAADCNDTPFGARASWCPTGGHFTRAYENLLVAASGGISSPELYAIAPFDFDRAEALSPDLLEGSVVEDFSLTRKRARHGLYALIDAETARHVDATAPGTKTRNLHTNPLITNTTATPVLLPVWIAAYRYHDRPYRVVLNGQTARATGTAPTSVLKVLAAIGIGAAVVIGALALFAHL